MARSKIILLELKTAADSRIFLKHKEGSIKGASYTYAYWAHRKISFLQHKHLSADSYVGGQAEPRECLQRDRQKRKKG